MASSCIQRGFDRHLTSSTNKWCDSAAYWLGMLDDGVFKCGQYGATLGEHVSKIVGDSASAERCHTVANAFGFGRDILGAIKCGPALHKLFTGQVFWHTDKNGFRKLKVDEYGNYVTIAKGRMGWDRRTDGTWFRAATLENSSDGVYIDDPDGSFLRRDLRDIAMTLLALVARILSPFRFLHNMKVVDLGDYAKHMGHVVMGVWGAVLSINLAKSIEDIVNEVDSAAIRKQVWEIFQGAVDLAALPFDFGVGSGHPALAMTGAVLNLVSAGSLIVKDLVYYG